MKHPQQTPPPSRHLSRRNTRSLVPGTYEANPRSDCPIDAALVHCSSILRRSSSSTTILLMPKVLARRPLPFAFPPSFFPPLLQPSKCGPAWPRAFECPRFHPSRSRRTISAFREGTRTRRDAHQTHLYHQSHRLNRRSVEEQARWFYRRRGFYSPDPAHPFHAAPPPLGGNVTMILRPLLAHHHQRGLKQKNNIKRDKV